MHGPAVMPTPPTGVSCTFAPRVARPWTPQKADAVSALGLGNGVFGLQLVVDASLGCTLLEANLRPHGWA